MGISQARGGSGERAQVHQLTTRESPMIINTPLTTLTRDYFIPKFCTLGLTSHGATVPACRHISPYTVSCVCVCVAKIAIYQNQSVTSEP